MKDGIDEAHDMVRRTLLRQSYYAKWTGEKFLYGEDAREFRIKEDSIQVERIEDGFDKQRER